MYKVLDLFSGAGGMAEGFIRAGFKIPYATDISSQAMKTYVNRHQQLGYDVNFICKDLNDIINDKIIISELKSVNFDVVVGGPPCQGFSNAGKRSQEDSRNMLVSSYLKMIKEIKPKYFVMENVTGIASFEYDEFIGVSGNIYNNCRIIEILIEEFKLIGYHVRVQILDAYDYGVPQRRRRVFLFGNMSGLPMIGEPEISNERYTAWDAIEDLVRNRKKNKFQQDSINGRTPCVSGGTLKRKMITNNELSLHKKLTVERFRLIKQGETFKNVYMYLSDENKEKYKTKKNNCKRLEIDEPSPTVVTLPDDYIHYSEDRIMSVRELARLQSFDDSFEFLGKRTTGGKQRKKETPQYTLVGNAVPPVLSYAVAKSVMEALLNGK